MRRVIWTTGSLVVLALTACAPKADPAADQAALRAADSAYTAGMRALDVPGLVSLYAADAVMYPPGEPTRTGLDAIREFATEFAAAPGISMTAQLQTLEVSGDMGYTVNMVDITANDAEGKPVTEHLRDVHVWRKDSGGQWKLAVDVWNALPAESAPAAD